MNVELIDKFKHLPEEIIHMIINYTNVVVYRHGKYINRVNKNDDRYEMLKRVQQPIQIGINTILLRLLDRSDTIQHGYLLYYNLEQHQHTKLNVRFVCRDRDSIDKYIVSHSNLNYILDHNNVWRLLIDYSM